MKYRALGLTFCIWAGFLTVLSQADGQRPLSLADILAWKRIQAPAVSNDGEWFAYRVAPAEGNAEVIVRNLKSGKELRFPSGDAAAAAPATPAGAPAPAPVPAAAPAVARDPAISADSRWVAFNMYPTTREAKSLKKAKKAVQTKVVLVELATGKKVEFEKIRRFAFSGEKSTTLALQRYGADAAPGPAAGGSGSTPAADRPSGTDLLLYDLASGNQLSLGNVSEFSFDKKGDWLAWLVDAADKAGNGVQLRNMNTGAVQALDSAPAAYRSLTWTEKGDGLAALRGADDKGYEDKLYSVVAFRDFTPSGPPAKVVFDPQADKSFPSGMTVSPNRNPQWREDFSAVTFGIHEVKAKKNAPKEANAAKEPAPADGDKKDAASSEEDRPDLVIWHWKDPRLPSMQQVQENTDKNFSYLCAYRPE